MLSELLVRWKMWRAQAASCEDVELRGDIDDTVRRTAKAQTRIQLVVTFVFYFSSVFK